MLLIGTIAYAAFSYCVECAGIQLVLSAVWLITLYCIDGGVFYYRQK
ncbi:MAG: hypothetical protein PUD20_07900 [bacterium]|nr:hypothetical protein [bacterium]